MGDVGLAVWCLRMEEHKQKHRFTIKYNESKQELEKNIFDYYN